MWVPKRSRKGLIEHELLGPAAHRVDASLFDDERDLAPPGVVLNRAHAACDLVDVVLRER
jgi:hypothetical protein